MDIIGGPRGSFKTSSLIHRSAKEQIPIIAPTSMMASFIARDAKEMNLDIPEPVSINKIVNRGGRPGKYLIDELEMCLNQLGIDPVAITIRTGSENL